MVYKFSKLSVGFLSGKANVWFSIVKIVDLQTKSIREMTSNEHSRVVLLIDLAQKSCKQVFSPNVNWVLNVFYSMNA